MNKWYKAAQAVSNETTIALQTLYDNLNQGQQRKVLKSAEVKALFDRYGVSYTE